MPTRDFQNNNRITEWTDSLLIVPNMWGLVNQLNMFQTKGISQNSYTFDEVIKSQVLLLDTPRGERSVYGKQEDRKTHSIPLPHFTYDDSIEPSDLQGVRRNSSPDEPTSLEIARGDVLERARRNWAITQEYSRMQALQGNVYAPNGTVSVNWYSEFGVAQKEVDFDLGTPTTDTIEKAEEVIAHMQDNLFSGEMVGDSIVFCSPEFFAKLIKQDKTFDAYTYYQATNQANGAQPLRDRLTYQRDARHRVFEHGGLMFVEYRGSFPDKDGNALPMVPAGEAYACPLNVSGMYTSIYGPAHRLSTVNTIGEEQYIFEEIIQDKRWEYESESNFLHMVNRPGAIVKLISST